MPNYRFSISRTYSQDIEIEAANEEEAYDLAWDRVDESETGFPDDYVELTVYLDEE